MNTIATDNIKSILDRVSSGALSVEDAIEELKVFPYKELDHTKLDTHRCLRKGFPEVVFCQGKDISHIIDIVEYLKDKTPRLLLTRADESVFEKVSSILPGSKYNCLGRTISWAVEECVAKTTGTVAIVTAGTSDAMPAQEAKETLSIMGHKTRLFCDVGVAGLHRLLAQIDELKKCSVIIVVAGMDGALPSVVAGLLDKPVIAVPTSVGYGANFDGLAPLLTMLNSCSPGITVVNIDNGFGAAYFAGMINR